MRDLARIAATEWARSHAAGEHDPSKFGRDVASVFEACRNSPDKACGDVVTSAEAVALSIPSEVPPPIWQLPSLVPDCSGHVSQTDLAGTE